MRSIFAAIIAVLILLVPSAGHAQRNEIIYAFRNFKTEPPQRMILVGEIQSKTKVATPQEKEPFRGYDTREDQVTVKVQNRRGLKKGQLLYIVDKNPHHKQYRNGLIVGEIRVRSILYNPFYGWVLTGTGILLRVREGQFVARTLDTENLERAYVLKKRGDHFANRGDVERAISSYNAALVADRTLPEANAALGDLFLSMARDSGREVPERALGEYRKAWRNRVNFRYEYEAYQYYRNYMDALYLAYELRRNEASRGANLVTYLDRIVEIGDVARQLGRDDGMDHADILLRLARAHYLRTIYYAAQSSSDERARYDASRDEAEKLLMELLEREPAYRRAELYRIALLHYGRVYEMSVLKHEGPRTGVELEKQRALEKRLRNLAAWYRRYHQDSPPGPDELRILRMIERLPAPN